MNANLYSPEHMMQVEYTRHPQDYDMGTFHYHNAYELLFLQEGEYTLITMDTAYTMHKNQVSLLPPYCMHKSLGRAGNERTLMYFDDRFLNRYFTEKSRSLLLSCFAVGQLSLSGERFSEALGLLFQIRDLVHKNKYDRAYPAFVRILSLLGDACRENALNPIGKDREKSAESTPLIAEVITYINQNYSTIRCLDDIASHFYITKYHLCRLFRSATSSTVMDHLNSIRLLQACSLLENTSKSITDISYACGFHSSAYFSDIFKKALGMSPRAYRRLKS